ncbi:MAG TPA: alanine racemase [Kineosporiaceae bacterium]|nr:alanine racemase [Kineosporiaceae bacterium]
MTTQQPATGTPVPPAQAALPPGLPACAVIDLDAVRDNVAALRALAGDAGLMAVVKADAYGHGLLPVARAALDGGAAWLGVAQLAEALQLRAAGITVPLLSWLTVPGDRFAEAVEAGVDLGASAPWALAEIAAGARRAGRPGRVHLKLDTGLSRNGVALGQWPGLVGEALKLQAEGLVELVGAMSHYAWADAPEHPTVRAQTAAFAEAVALAERLGARFEVRHLANSAATLTNPDARYDLVRPGLAVYGLSPVPDLGDPQRFGLRPAMSLYGRVALVKRVPAGSGVSYGHTYTTPADTTVALIPLGYADGVPRHAGNAGPVALRGRRYTVAGRVCMDQVVLDLGDPGNGTGVTAGDVATLFGDPAAGVPSAEDWAQAAGTISYEIVTRLGVRVPRVYVGSAGTTPGTPAGTTRAGMSG